MDRASKSRIGLMECRSAGLIFRFPRETSGNGSERSGVPHRVQQGRRLVDNAGGRRDRLMDVRMLGLGVIEGRGAGEVDRVHLVDRLLARLVDRHLLDVACRMLDHALRPNCHARRRQRRKRARQLQEVVGCFRFRRRSENSRRTEVSIIDIMHDTLSFLPNYPIIVRAIVYAILIQISSYLYI